MIKFFITAVLSSAALFAPAQPSVPPNFTPQLILSGIDPVSMAADPEGRIFLTEKDGNLLLVKPDVPGSTLVAKLQVDQAGERGLLGVAVHPEFEYNHYIYLYYSVLNGNHNRLSRFVVHEEHIHLEEEEILLDFEPLNGFYHNGGDLKFGPDGMLYVSTGDGFNSTMAQSHTSLLGKVLRLRDNGTIPTDNPFYFTNSGIYKAIYALGFRNPFTFSFNNMAKLFVNDVGNTKWEEINNVLPGKNYGWPYIEGRAADNPDAIVPADYLDPFYVYDHDVGCAVTGAAFYDGDVQSFPSEYYGKYFFGDYCNGTIRAIDPISGEKLDFLTNSERAVYITFIRGDLYYMSFPGGKQGKLWRIYYSTDDKPQIVIQPTSQLATHDETVQFSVEAAGEGPFQYQWYRDGSALQGQVNKLLILENVQLSDNGSSFVCIVSNQNGFVESAPATLSVTDRERPTLTLETPWADYVAGEQITVSGSAFDAVDGALDRSKLTWRVDFQHDFHSHPLVTNLSNSNEVSFTVPKVGETSSNTWVRIYLVAENSIGLTAERFIEIYPKKSTFTVDASHNDNLLVSLDGKAYQVPFNIEAVVGTTRSLFGALEQYKGQNLYLFQDWNRQIYSTALTFDVAESDTTFTINYEKIFLGKGTGLTGFYYNGYKKFSGNPQLVRIDSMINFNWYAGSPDPDINVDNFSVVWSGYIRIPIDGTYNFHTTFDDGMRMWIDDELIFDEFVYKDGKEVSVGKTMRGGQLYKIDIQYFEGVGGGASFKLLWSSDKLLKGTIPTEVLYPGYLQPTVFFLDTLTTFELGKPLPLEAAAADFEGHPLSHAQFQWDVSVKSDDGILYNQKFTGTRKPAVILPDTLDLALDVLLEVHLVVSDISGFEKIISKTLSPVKRKVTIDSEQEVTVDIDSEVLVLPWERELISGYKLSYLVRDSVFNKNKTLFVLSDWETNNPGTFNVFSDTTVYLPYSTIPLSDGRGLLSYYYKGNNGFESAPDLVKLTEKIDTTFTNQAEGLKVKWSGWIQAPLSGRYSFKVHSDQNVSVSIDEVEVADHNGLSASIEMTEGDRYPLTVTYDQDGESGFIRVSWHSNSFPEHGLDKEQLFSTSQILDVEENIASKITVHPNPTSNKLVVTPIDNNNSRKAGLKIKLLRLFTNQGVELKVRIDSANDGRWILNMRDVPSGVYILHIHTGSIVEVKKVIKN